MIKNNLIYFNKSVVEDDGPLSTEILNNILEKITPSIKEVFDIERESLANCDNFTEYNRILSKYSLSVKDINRHLTNDINLNKLLNYKIHEHDKNSELDTLNSHSARINYTLYNKYFNNIVVVLKKIEADRELYKSDNNDICIHSLNRMIYNKIWPYFKNEPLKDLLDFLKNRLQLINYQYPNESTSEELKKSSLVEHIIEVIVVYSKINDDKMFPYNLKLFNNNIYNKILNKEYPAYYNDHFRTIYKIYNIKKLEIDNLNQKNNLSLNDLQCIDLMNQLNNTFDKGQLLYSVFKIIDLENKLENGGKELDIMGEAKYIEANKGNISVNWSNIVRAC